MQTLVLAPMRASLSGFGQWLKRLWYSWDPMPIGWRATVRLGVILFAIEVTVCLVLIQIINWIV